eukprot:TRINITY_DN27412_c0_g1_i2.p1 TRINITY_DN27412_c0_g1~~TRINITY_DN27412_c0_g1_i2.p1  ORF type:complete len:802 (-),score=158.32 TRINITY_DN27412_c0_g1_i2:45-2450(-)
MPFFSRGKSPQQRSGGGSSRRGGSGGGSGVPPSPPRPPPASQPPTASTSASPTSPASAGSEADVSRGLQRLRVDLLQPLEEALGHDPNEEMIPWVDTLLEEAFAQVSQLQHEAEACIESGRYDLMEQIVQSSTDFEDMKLRAESWKTAAAHSAARSPSAPQVQSAPSAQQSGQSFGSSPGRSHGQPAAQQSGQSLGSPLGRTPGQPATQPQSQNSFGSQGFSFEQQPQSLQQLRTTSSVANSPTGSQSGFPPQSPVAQQPGAFASFPEPPQQPASQMAGRPQQSPGGQQKSPKIKSQKSSGGKKQPSSDQVVAGQQLRNAFNQRTTDPQSLPLALQEARLVRLEEVDPELMLQAEKTYLTMQEQPAALRELQSATSAVLAEQSRHAGGQSNDDSHDLDRCLAQLRSALSRAEAVGVAPRELHNSEKVWREVTEFQAQRHSDHAADQLGILAQQEQQEREEEERLARAQHEMVIQRQTELLQRAVSEGGDEDKINYAIQQARAVGVPENVIKKAEEQAESARGKKTQAAQQLQNAIQHGVHHEEVQKAIAMAEAAGVDKASCEMARKVAKHRCQAHDHMVCALVSKDPKELREAHALVQASEGPQGHLHHLQRAIDQAEATRGVASSPPQSLSQPYSAGPDQESQLLHRLRSARQAESYQHRRELEEQWQRELEQRRRLHSSAGVSQSQTSQQHAPPPHSMQSLASRHAEEVNRQQRWQEWQSREREIAQEEAQFHQAFQSAKAHAEQTRHLLSSVSSFQPVQSVNNPFANGHDAAQIARYEHKHFWRPGGPVVPVPDIRHF